MRHLIARPSAIMCQSTCIHDGLTDQVQLDVAQLWHSSARPERGQPVVHKVHARPCLCDKRALADGPAQAQVGWGTWNQCRRSSH